MNVNSSSVTRIENYIEEALKAWGIPGGAVLILSEKEILSCRGYGVKELGKADPVDENTVFAIGSCTKAFTAAALGVLVDDGKLGWDDKVRKYLPQFELYDPWITQDVTIRDILSHRMGITRTQRLMNRDRVFNPDDVIQRTKYMPPFAPFRSRFGYTNTGYMLAGKIIEVVSGQAWDDFIEQRFCKPLGMSSTSATYTRMLEKGLTNIACPHSNLVSSLVPQDLRMLEPVQPIPWTDYGKNAAGSITSDPTDSIAWLRMLLGNGSYQGRQCIKPDTLREMFRPQMIIDPQESELAAIYAVGLESNFLTYGLGWFVMDFKGRNLILHGGQIYGFNSAIAIIPSMNIGIVIYLNVYQTLLHAMLGFYIIDALMGTWRDYSEEMITLALGWRQQAETGLQHMEHSRQKDHAPSLPLEMYVGSYTSNLYGEIRVSYEEGKLVTHYGDSQYFLGNLEHWEKDTFVVHYRYPIHESEFITFIIETDKRIRSLELKNLSMFVGVFIR